MPHGIPALPASVLRNVKPTVQRTGGRALGTDDSITTCDCCGRANLKFTVTIQLDDGEQVHYGQVCAARNTGKTPKVIRAEIATETKRIRDAAAAEFKASPEHLAYEAKLAKRNRDRAGLIGRAAFDFVASESIAADAARVRIAAKFGLQSSQVYA